MLCSNLDLKFEMEHGYMHPLIRVNYLVELSILKLLFEEIWIDSFITKLSCWESFSRFSLHAIIQTEAS